MALPAREERERLCDLMREVGPDAPTLCGDWTTRDLAAHLVVRERRPDAAIGIVVKPLAGHTERVRRKEAERDYSELVERVRSGPPLLSALRPPPIERLVNTIEFFVHHEDVRRGRGVIDVRVLDERLEQDLLGPFSRGVRMLARSSPAGIVLHPHGRDPIVAKRAPGSASVAVSGPLGELVLFMYGRQGHAAVDLSGAQADIDAVCAASFGI